jgi:DNA-binding FrmR family transcriptional regulator
MKKDKRDKKKAKKEKIRADENSRDEVKRLNRVIGQIEGIQKMIDDARALDEILVQCKAVHSALKSVESRLLERYLDVALTRISKTEKKKSREEKIDELLDLYKAA